MCVRSFISWLFLLFSPRSARQVVSSVSDDGMSVECVPRCASGLLALLFLIRSSLGVGYALFGVCVGITFVCNIMLCQFGIGTIPTCQQQMLLLRLSCLPFLITNANSHEGLKLAHCPLPPGNRLSTSNRDDRTGWFDRMRLYTPRLDIDGFRGRGYWMDDQLPAQYMYHSLVSRAQ